MCKGIKWSIQECLGKGLKGVFKMLFHDFLSLLFGSLKFRLQSLYYTFNYCKLTKNYVIYSIIFVIIYSDLLACIPQSG